MIIFTVVTVTILAEMASASKRNFQGKKKRICKSSSIFFFFFFFLSSKSLTGFIIQKNGKTRRKFGNLKARSALHLIDLKGRLGRENSINIKILHKLAVLN